MAKAQDLTDCLAIYSSIIGLLEKTNDMEKMLVLVQKIFHLQGCLGIKYVGTQKDGDMLFMELNTGLNIYDIPRSLHRIERVFNSILFFTGNKDVESICNKGAGPYLRDGLYRLNNYHRAKGGVEVHYESEFLPLLHELYEISGYEFMLRDSILWATHANLSVVLSSYDEVKKLKEFDYADELTDKIMEDIKSASEKYKDNPEIKAYIDKADRCHWAAMESLGVLR
nr:hypothetical protein [Pseudomonas toyotomiensis]